MSIPLLLLLSSLSNAATADPQVIAARRTSAAATPALNVNADSVQDKKVKLVSQTDENASALAKFDPRHASGFVDAMDHGSVTADYARKFLIWLGVPPSLLDYHVPNVISP